MSGAATVGKRRWEVSGACDFPSKIKALPTVEVTICNTVVPALVDTGSSCSLVSLQLLSDLGLSYMVRGADCCSVLVANGNSIEVK